MLVRVFTVAVAALFFTASSLAARAQDYPTRYIRIVNPYTPGGPADSILRLLAPKMEEVLGQKLVIENKPGAAGNIGTIEVANSPADGYTILMAATNNLVINQFVTKMSVDPLQTLKPVAKIVDVPIVLFSNPSVPAKDFKQFMSHVRSHPGKINYGTPGQGTVNHLLMERMKQTTGMDMLHIPYRGGAPGILAVMSNDIQLFAVGLVVGAGQLKDGKITALAVSTADRLGALPDVQTLTEAGLIGLSAANWWALAVPVGTPEHAVTKLREALQAALREPQLIERFETLGLVVPKESPDNFADGLKAEAALWSETVRKGSITVQ
jgi:tripartite-type tricarboxylate transporter receptor subunit TctC